MKQCTLGVGAVSGRRRGGGDWGGGQLSRHVSPPVRLLPLVRRRYKPRRRHLIYTRLVRTDRGAHQTATKERSGPHSGHIPYIPLSTSYSLAWYISLGQLCDQSSRIFGNRDMFYPVSGIRRTGFVSLRQGTALAERTSQNTARHGTDTARHGTDTARNSHSTCSRWFRQQGTG